MLTICIALIFILSAIPIAAAAIANNGSAEKAATKSEPFNGFDTASVINAAVKICDESFCDEALKAILAISENNLKFSEAKIETASDTSTDEGEKVLIERLRKLYKSNRIQLLYKGSSVYIPYSSLSSGNTSQSNKYPYMTAVASPWDCNNVSFVYGKDYAEGLSIGGINSLCENGMSAEDALRWYLPEFEVA